MSYLCAGCHRHKDGKPIKKPTEIRIIGEIVQETYSGGLVRAYIKEEGIQIAKEEGFCPDCSGKIGEPKVVGLIEKETKGG